MENFNLTGGLNSLDIFVILSYSVILFLSWRKGLLLSLYGLSSFAIAIFLANRMYPAAGFFMRGNDAVYSWIKSFVEGNLNFSEASGLTAKHAQNILIENLGLPGVLTNALIENNNPEVYGLLNVSSLEDYVVELITGTVINIASGLAVFVFISIFLTVLSRSLGILSRLPVIKTFNKAGGLLLGFLTGTLFVSLAFLVMIVFFQKDYEAINNLADSSLLAKHFFNNDIFEGLVLRIIKRGI